MKKNYIWLLAAILLCGTMALLSCSDSNDNKDDKETPTPEPTPEPTDDLADYTVFIYGYAGGQMDHIIDGVYENVKPMLTDKKKVRVLVFYKYGHKTKEYPFSGNSSGEATGHRARISSTSS